MLPTTREDREHQSYRETDLGKTAVAIVQENCHLVPFHSNTALSNGGSYDSGILDLENYQYFFREVFADQDGTLVGYWYDDAAGTNIIRTFTNPYVTTQGLLSDGSTKLTRYLRLVFTNTSGADQSVFHIRLRLANNPPAAPLVAGDQFLPSNSRGILTRSIITGFNPSGNYQNVRVNEYGALSNSSFVLDVSRGSVDNVTSFVKTGRNPEVNANTAPEDIWHGGGLYTGQPEWGTTPETIEVFSSSVSDTLAGTGARTITLYGLDANGEYQQATVSLNGTTPVTIPTLIWARMNYAVVSSVGSNQFNVGNITARWTTTTTQIFMVMPAGVNKTAIGASTVPLGKSRSIFSSTCRIARLSGAAGSANVRFLYREPNGVWMTKINEEVTTDSPFVLPNDVYINLPELTDFKWQITSVSDNATIGTCKIPWVEFTQV